MSSNSIGEFEKSSAPARITVGNRRAPSLFIIRDHRLRVVLAGVTPATVELQAGVYEIKVHSEGEARSSLLQAEPGSRLDASSLGVRVETDVPVSCARNRDQFVAEAVSRASGALRDIRCGSGLAIIVLDKTAGAESSAARPDTRFTVLDATYRELHHQVAELEGGALCWHSAADPGGYVVRLGGPGDPVEMPVWVSSGFQTILFLPLADSWLAGRASVHMVPIGWVWTGFDLAAGLLELALNSMRKGRRPFGESSPGPDIAILARTNPVLGLIRIHDLWHFSPDGDEFRLLASRLEHLVPGHPDLLAITSGDQLGFPPMFASGIPASLSKVRGASHRVAEGSLLEASYERLTRYGPLVTWQAGTVGISDDTRFTARKKASPGSPVALTIGLSSVIERLRRPWILFTGALAARRLFRRPPENVVEVLRRLGEASSIRQVALYLADLALVGQSRRVKGILAGLNLQDLSEATSLPRPKVESALFEIRSGLTRARIAGQVGRRGNGGKEDISPTLVGWWLILALVVVGIGYALGLWLLGSRSPVPLVSSSGAIFGILVSIALAIERVLEPFSNWLGPSSADATPRRDQKVMASPQSPTSHQIVGEAAESQGRLARARAMKAIITWAVATALAYIVCGGLKILLFSAVVHTKEGMPWRSLDLLVTGLLVGAITKPVHALISNIEKRSRKD